MVVQPASAVRRMTRRDIRRHVGQYAIVGFDGTAIPQEVRALAREFDLGGVIVFARNVEAPEQVAELAHEAQTLAQDLPLWVGVDQEGGRVARLRAPFTEWPPMAVLGNSGDTDLTERFARALASELSGVGITLDFAPVLDVHSNPKNPVIGDRALSSDPVTVARLGAVIIRTLQANGIAACGKHFPGHGDTSEDSHHELPVVDHPPDQLREREWVPFRAAIDAGVAVVMTAHVLVPALDAERPATLSRTIVHDQLRQALGQDGLIAADDLQMQAIAGSYTLEDAAAGAVGAGCDLVLLCGTDVGRQAAALEAIIHAVEAGTLSVRDVEAAMARQGRVKARFLGSIRARPRATRRISELVGRSESWAVAEEIARHA